MKKIIYILVALLAFAVGVFVFLVQPLFVTVRLYDLKGPEFALYKSQKIKVKGFMIVDKSDSEYFYYLQDEDISCANEVFECRVAIAIELSQDTEKINLSWIDEIAEKNDQSRKTGFFDGEYGAEVELIGYVGNEKEKIIYINVEEVKQISPIKLIEARPNAK